MNIFRSSDEKVRMPSFKIKKFKKVGAIIASFFLLAAAAVATYYTLKPQEVMTPRAEGPLISEGFPISHPYDSSLASDEARFATGNIAGDAKKEIVLVHDCDVFAYDYKGQSVSGFPAKLSNCRHVASDSSLYGPRDLLLTDIDGDGLSEILVAQQGYDNYVEGFGKTIIQRRPALYVYKGDGTTYAGFPVRLSTGTTNSEDILAIKGNLVAGDVDGDGRITIFVSAKYPADPTTDFIYAFDTKGNARSGWPKKIIMSKVNKTVTSGQTEPSMVLANLDADNALEVLVMDKDLSRIFAWNVDGTDVGGWPANVGKGKGEPFNKGMAVGYDKSGQLVVAVYIADMHSSYPCSSTDPCRIYLLNNSGSVMPGWPQDIARRDGMPLLMDGDGDGEVEVFYVSSWSTGAEVLSSLNLDGTASSSVSLSGGNFPQLYGGVKTNSEPAVKVGYGGLGQWRMQANLGLVKVSGGVNNFIWKYSNSSEYEFTTPLLTDLDNDGLLDVVAVSNLYNPKLYSWELQDQNYVNGDPFWPMLFHDAYATKNANISLASATEPVTPPTTNPIPSEVPSAKGTLTVIVKDSVTGEVVPEASVSVNIAGQKGKAAEVGAGSTNTSGVYVLSVDEGSYDVTVSAKKYRKFSQETIVSGGEFTTLNFNIDPL